MKLSEIPAGATFLDVDSIAVARLPDGAYIAFDSVDVSRPYPNASKAGLEGDRLTAREFRAWLESGRNRFDRP